MKKLILTVIIMFVALTCTLTSSSIAANTTTVLSYDNSEAKEEFYVKQQANKIYWGGGFTVDTYLSGKDYKLYIAFYDNDKLISTESVYIDETLDSFTFNEQCIRLSYAPENVTAKAFLWADGTLEPLANAIQKTADVINDITSVSLASANSEEYFDYVGHENNIKLLNNKGVIYLEGDFMAEFVGDNTYTLYVELKNGNTTLDQKEIELDSKMKRVYVLSGFNVETSDYLYLYMDMHIIHDGKELCAVQTVDVQKAVTLTEDSEFCVVSSISEGENPYSHDGTIYKCIEYYSAESNDYQYVYVKDNDFVLPQKGDIFVYSVDIFGFLFDYKLIYEVGTFEKNLASASTFVYNPIQYQHTCAYDDVLNSWKNSSKVNLGFGAIIEKGSDYVTVGIVKQEGTIEVTDENNNKITINNYVTTDFSELDISSDVNIYEYDVNEKVNKVSVGTVAKLSPTRIASIYQNDGEKYEWTRAGRDGINKSDSVKFILYKYYNGEITDAVVFIPEEFY